MSMVGNQLPSFICLNFVKRTPYLQFLIDEVNKTARGRTYNTPFEDLLVIRATHGELFSDPAKENKLIPQ